MSTVEDNKALALRWNRIADGKVLETWRNADGLEWVLQLGGRIEPPPG